MVNTAALTDGETLIHQRGQRHFPALADIAQTLAVGYTHIIEEHFIKAAAAGNLLNRANFNARRFHIEEEKGQAFMLRHGRVRAGDDNAVIAKMRARRPNLLAINHPFIAVFFAFRAQTRDIGTGGRF